jgi:hydrogenase-4 component F
MSASWLLAGLYLTYIVAAAAAFIGRGLGAWTQYAVESIHVVAVTVGLGLALAIGAYVLANGNIFLFDDWFMADPLGCIFAGLVALVGFLAGLYSIGYVRHDVASGKVSPVRIGTYYGFYHLFLLTMTMAATSNNILLMWVSIEATTLSSAFLVGFYQDKAALEAAWKYVIICTVGVGFGLYGTILVFSNATAVFGDPANAMLWTEIVKHASLLDKSLVPIAFAFVLIGFGTKIGLFPMHVWVPDAEGEAPSPVSALLAAALTADAVLIVIRYIVIANGSIGPALPQTLCMILGILSIAIASPVIFVERDIKRLLAYCTIENMGIIALALGLGGPLGITAALLHTLNHGLAKTLMFCGAGNVLIKYGTRDLDKIKGLMRLAPASGAVLIAGSLALGGAPPFACFVSEFTTVVAGVKAGYWWLMVIAVLLLAVVLAGFGRLIGGSLLGAAPAGMRSGDLGLLILGPLGLTLALLLLMGVYVPKPVSQVIAQATESVLHAPEATAGAIRPASAALTWPSVLFHQPRAGQEASASDGARATPGSGG